MGRHQPAIPSRRQHHFRDVNVAAAIDPDAMRGEEVARRAGIPAASPARSEFPAWAENAHAPARSVGVGSGRPRPHSRAETQFRHVDIAPAVDENLTRPGDVGPLGQVVAVRREKLDSAILTIRDVDYPPSIHGDAMRHMKFAGTAAWLPPAEDEPPIRGKLVNSRVAVTVADVDFSMRGERHVGRIMEGRAGPKNGALVNAGGPGVRGPAVRTQGQQKPSVRSELADGVVGVVGAVDGVIRPDE